MYEVVGQVADGTFRSRGCFADDGSPVSREELFAAIGPLPSTDEFMAAACPPGGPERAALPDRWVVRLIQLAERRAAALAAERAELVGVLATQRPAEGSVPEGSVPEDAVPEDAVPEDAVPEDAVPEDAVPEDAVPEDAVPEDAVP
ncbi:hypothetical protein ACI780_23895, partial [Geodermatophilus sp. SYSU D00814]